MAEKKPENDAGKPVRDAAIAMHRASQSVRDVVHKDTVAAADAAHAELSQSSGSEGTGDPVRDAIIAQGKAEQERREPLTTEQAEAFRADFDQDWLTPADALDLLVGTYIDPFTRKKWVIDRLKSGLIMAAARTIESRGQLFEFGGVGAPIFQRFGQYGEDHFWETGDFDVEVQGITIRMFDIRFDPDSFSGKPTKAKRPVIDTSAHETSQDARPKMLAGAHRKGWWDDLWIEMIRRIRAGTLAATNKRELQDALEDYVDQIGGKYGDSTLKPMASKLFEYLEEIRGK